MCHFTSAFIESQRILTQQSDFTGSHAQDSKHLFEPAAKNLLKRPMGDNLDFAGCNGLYKNTQVLTTFEIGLLPSMNPS